MAHILLASLTTVRLSSNILSWVLENIILVLTLCLLLVLVISIFYALRLLDGYINKQKEHILLEQGITPVKREKKKKEPSLFSKLYDKAWAIVPIENEDSIDLDHDYDGIRELDNRLPPWWLYGFYFTIIFGIGYLYVYHFSDLGLSQQEEYEVAMKKAEEEKMIYLASIGGGIDETNVEFTTKAEALASGKEVYIANCATCHGALGEGLVGPNLTDKYWINGGGIANVFKTIKYGVPEKGMIPWEAQLRPETMQNLASYILTLEGSNPPNQKAAEGPLWESNDNQE